mgnify:CR=1 FL=1
MTTTNMQPTPRTLWHITEGQRLYYLGAVLAMALSNLFMFGAPLVGKYAIDIVIASDLEDAAAGGVLAGFGVHRAQV